MLTKPAQPGADDLYQKLRALEFAVPPIPAIQTVSMGSWVAGSNFVGTASTCSIVGFPVKHRQCIPPTVTINAINAVLTFSVPNGVTLTAAGRTVQSSNGQATVDVGNADVVDWRLQSGAHSYADKVIIARPAVAGMGAFTIAALPISIIYEPPQNAAFTNSATIQFATESTVVDTISKSSGTTNTPTWAGGEAALMVGQKMASITPQTSAAWPLISGVISALSSQPVETFASQVNTDRTLSVRMTDHQVVTTAAHSGPGRGDLIAFYRNARVIWGMDAGKVTLTLLDHGGLSMFSIDHLRADLAALARGQAARSGLDAPTITSLIALDPLAQARPIMDTILSVPNLPPRRFAKKNTLNVNAARFTQTFTHSISQSDKASKLQTTTTVTDSHGGWLTLLGIGSQTGGKMTTQISLGSSRTTSDTQTKSASYSLEAGPNEAYTVEVYYDNIFGTFLMRAPSASIGPVAPAAPAGRIQ